MEDLLTAACSSIFPGAGTNQELALHCLHESRGDILVRPCPPVEEGPLGRLAGSHVSGPGARPVSELIRSRREGLTKVGVLGGWPEGALVLDSRLHCAGSTSSLWEVGPPPLRQGCPLRTFSICDCLPWGPGILF